MLHWAAACLVIALTSALIGFGGISCAATGTARCLFFVFIVLAAGGFAINALRERG